MVVAKPGRCWEKVDSDSDLCFAVQADGQFTLFLSDHFCCRYIRSERSVILINFCLSIISSNALILIGQTQTWNKVKSPRCLVIS